MRYKDHKLTEIEIAPVAENYGLQGHTAARAINLDTLGVLRENVKLRVSKKFYAAPAIAYYDQKGGGFVWIRC